VENGSLPSYREPGKKHKGKGTRGVYSTVREGLSEEWPIPKKGSLSDKEKIRRKWVEYKKK